MSYPDPKGDVDKSMPGKRRSGLGVRDDAPRDPRDMAKAGLPDIPISRRCKEPSVGKIPETGAHGAGFRYLSDGWLFASSGDWDIRQSSFRHITRVPRRIISDT